MTARSSPFNLFKWAIVALVGIAIGSMSTFTVMHNNMMELHCEQSKLHDTQVLREWQRRIDVAVLSETNARRELDELQVKLRAYEQRTTTTVATAAATSNVAVESHAIESGASGTLCGNVDQQPFEYRVDEWNNETRVWTRPQWIWYKNQGKLPPEWQQLDESLQENIFIFANEGQLHAMDW